MVWQGLISTTLTIAKKIDARAGWICCSVMPLETEKWDENPGIADLKDYYISKHYADHWLVNSAFDYTMVQPGALKERAGTGKITINDTSSGENAIEDVATTLAAVLTADNTIGKVFNLHNGDIDINEAVATV